MARRRRMQSIFTEDETQIKVQSMARYIEDDGIEKAQEIEVLAEAEFHSEKYKYIKQNMPSVEVHFDKLRENYSKSMDKEISVMKNTAYCNLLSARTAKVQEVIEIAKKRLKQFSRTPDSSAYINILQLLLSQGLLMMMEPEVNLTVRKQDVKSINSILEKSKSQYESKTGKPVIVNIQKNNNLNPENLGGIIMSTPKEHIRLDNTLETRLGLMVEFLMPKIRNLIFGTNPNRKFFD